MSQNHSLQKTCCLHAGAANVPLQLTLAAVIPSVALMCVVILFIIFSYIQWRKTHQHTGNINEYATVDNILPTLPPRQFLNAAYRIRITSELISTEGAQHSTIPDARGGPLEVENQHEGEHLENIDSQSGRANDFENIDDSVMI